MEATKRSESKRRNKRRSCPNRGSPPPDASTVGEVYLQELDPPALTSSTEVYMQAYAYTRALLEDLGCHHATHAVKGAWDAAVQHVEQQIGAAGGEGR